MTRSAIVRAARRIGAVGVVSFFVVPMVAPPVAAGLESGATSSGKPLPVAEPGAIPLPKDENTTESDALAAIPLTTAGDTVLTFTINPSGRLNVATQHRIWRGDADHALTYWGFTGEPQDFLDTETESVMTTDDTLLVLSAGTLYAVRDDGTVTQISVPPSPSADYGSPRFLAANEENVYLSTRSTVYTLNDQGRLDEIEANEYDRSGTVELPGEIYATATAGEQELYVAHDDAGEVVVSSVYPSGEISEEFRATDLEEAELQPSGMAVDSEGTLFITDEHGERIVRYASGRVTVIASAEDGTIPEGIPHNPSVDAEGTLVFAVGDEIHAIPDATGLNFPAWAWQALASCVALGIGGGLLLWIRRQLRTN